MKTRRGFVSNSSTTSYTCEMCGETASGFDSASIEDFGFFCCENGHELCLEHQLDVDDLTTEEKRGILLEDNKEYIEREPGQLQELMEGDEDYVNDWWADEGHNSYEVPAIYCPICQFLEISNSDTAAFLLRETGVPREDAFKFVKEQNKRRKKLYDSEYIMYVQMTLGRDISMLSTELKERFGTYKAFMRWLREK